MEQVIGALDSTGLTEREERQRRLVWIGQLANVRYGLINPGIFLVGKVDVMEGVVDETRVNDPLMPSQYPVYFIWA